MGGGCNPYTTLPILLLRLEYVKKIVSGRCNQPLIHKRIWNTIVKDFPVEMIMSKKDAAHELIDEVTEHAECIKLLLRRIDGLVDRHMPQK